MEQGYIPKEIIVVSAGPGLSGKWWGYTSGVLDDNEVIPAFPLDANSKSRLATARSWARRRNTAIEEVKYDNTPMQLQIVGLEYRRNSSTYKVVDQRNYLFDLREDVVLDAIEHTGIEPGGHMNGEYVWAILSSHTRIVRVGSDLWSRLLEASKRRELKRVGVKDLKPHHFYQDKRGHKALFVGFVTTEVDSKRYKGTLWLTLSRYNRREERSSQQLVEAYLDGKVESEYDVYPEVKKNYNFVEEVGILDGIPPGPGMIHFIRDKRRADFQQYLACRHQNYTPSRWDRERYGPVCNMAPYGEEPHVFPLCHA